MAPALAKLDVADGHVAVLIPDTIPMTIPALTNSGIQPLYQPSTTLSASIWGADIDAELDSNFGTLQPFDDPEATPPSATIWNAEIDAQLHSIFGTQHIPPSASGF